MDFQKKKKNIFIDILLELKGTKTLKMKMQVSKQGTTIISKKKTKKQTRTGCIVV